MPIPTLITDLSQTAGSNYPAGSDSPSVLDDVQRAHAGFIAQLRDGKGLSTPVTLASATTTDIGGQNSMFVEISGTVTITSLGTNYNGPRFLRFTGALTLTHNATTLNINSGASFTTTSGDCAIAIPNTALNGWNVQYLSLVGTESYFGSLKLANTTEALTGTDTTKAVTPAGLRAAASTPQIQNISAVASSNTMIVTIGATSLDFRSTNSTVGIPNRRVLGSATNITIPQGATLGAASGNITRITVGAIDNNGTIEAFVGGANCNYDESQLINITNPIGNSSNVFYGAANRTLVPFRSLGFIDSNQAAAGTYASQPLTVQGAGGNAPQLGRWQYIRYPAVSTSSGTSIDPFNGVTIPSWAKRITLKFSQTSTSTSDTVLIQLGTVGGFETTTYYSSTSSNGVTVSSTAGFLAQPRADSSWLAMGKMVLELDDSVPNKWNCVSNIGGSPAGSNSDIYVGAGEKTLSGLLTKLRFISTGGAAAFDSGYISAMVEG